VPAGELEAFRRFCAEELTTDLGAPLLIEPWQEAIVGPFLDGCRENIAVTPKKNGKSSLVGALSLYALCSLPDCSIAVVASARDQAQYVLDQARLYIRRNPRLRERLRVVERAIHHRTLGGKMVVRAADSDSLDGWLGDVAVCDELGRWQTFENLYLLRDGLGPRGGRLLGISTPAASTDSPLGQMRARAHDLPGFGRDGCHNRVRTANFSFNEWCIAPDDDFNDLELVKRANPLSSMTLEELRLRRESSPDWMWRRFACGQWDVLGEESAISPADWGQCAEPGVEIPAGAERVKVGVDIGYVRDCFAAVPAWRRDDGVIQLDAARVLVPPGDGTSLDIEDMVDVLHAAAGRWPGCAFVFDPMYGGQQLLQRLEREIPTSECIAYPQAPAKMSAASMGFAEMVSTHQLTHPAQAELTEHVLAAAPRFVGGERWRLAKPPGRRQVFIDAAVAAAMAADVAAADTGPARSVYEERFGLVEQSG
jgi:phage terminase large subunit-like protein